MSVSRACGILRLRRQVISANVLASRVPNAKHRVGGQERKGLDPVKNKQLDRTDVRILAALQKNGRMTNVELARRVGLSPSPCLERVKRLEKSGVIIGYGVYVDVDRLAPNITVFAEITLEAHHPQDFKQFEDAIKTIPEILDCYQMSGDYDYMLKILCRDTNAFQNIMENLINAEIGILKYFGHITLKNIKLASKEIPIQNLIGEN